MHPGDTLICSSKDTTSRIAVADWSHYSVEFQQSTVILQDPCLLRWLDRRAKGKCGRNHPTPAFSSLWWCHHFSRSSRDAILLLIHHSPRWRSLQRLPFHFSNHSPHSTGQETNVRILTSSIISTSIIYSGAGEMTTGWVWGPAGTPMIWTSAKTLLINSPL